MVRIKVEHRFDVSVHDGFEYITEPANWPANWPRFVRLDPASRWRAPRDRARLTLRILAREVTLEMTLARLEPYRVVEYASEQRGLPAARRWRHFQEVDPKASGDAKHPCALERVGEDLQTADLVAAIAPDVHDGQLLRPLALRQVGVP